ncbi:hypothetical protein FZEAL_1523 [Fusarium zealandicum]|uniref:Uncharacterized protein n=1 Tax=Fusarium zealandicum TaxID=1053134 RepID=A0A8H4USK0_9HYPO|nr:hypothetical protein FZEAL_1523 [Fusarium zealandicum]
MARKKRPSHHYQGGNGNHASTWARDMYGGHGNPSASNQQMRGGSGKGHDRGATHAASRLAQRPLARGGLPMRQSPIPSQGQSQSATPLDPFGFGNQSQAVFSNPVAAVRNGKQRYIPKPSAASPVSRPVNERGMPETQIARSGAHPDQMTSAAKPGGTAVEAPSATADPQVRELQDRVQELQDQIQKNRAVGNRVCTTKQQMAARALKEKVQELAQEREALRQARETIAENESVIVAISDKEPLMLAINNMESVIEKEASEKVGMAAEMASLREALQRARDTIAEKETLIVKEAAEKVEMAAEMASLREALSELRARNRERASTEAHVQETTLFSRSLDILSIRAARIPVVDDGQFGLDVVSELGARIGDPEVYLNILKFLGRGTMDTWFCLDEVYEKGGDAQREVNREDAGCEEHHHECLEPPADSDEPATYSDEAPESTKAAHQPAAEEISDDLNPKDRFEKVVWPLLPIAWRKGVGNLQRRLEELPIVTKELYEKRGMPGCPDPIFDDLWTQKDESQLLERWDDSVLKKAINRVGRSTQAIVSFCKVSLRIFGYDPLTLFTLSGDTLEFDASMNHTFEYNGQRYPSPLWPKLFCQRMTRIMTHPLWQGQENWSLMLFVLKWAVICRTDDRRPLSTAEASLLHWAGCYLDPDLPELSMAERHQEHQDYLWDQGGWPSPEADLLTAIAAVTKTSRPAEDPVEGNRYLVSTSDLTNVVKGLDSISSHSMSVDSETYHQIFLAAREDLGYPAEVDVPALYKNCWFNLERDRARRCRAKERGSTLTLGPDEQHDDGSNPLKGAQDSTLEEENRGNKDIAMGGHDETVPCPERSRGGADSLHPKSIARIRGIPGLRQSLIEEVPQHLVDALSDPVAIRKARGELPYVPGAPAERSQSLKRGREESPAR